MAYADQQMSGNKITALIIVALIHIVVGYALVTGLAFSAARQIIKRVTTVDIKEPEKPKEPPPPPPKQLNIPPPIVAPPVKIDVNVAPPPVEVVPVAPPPPESSEPKNQIGSIELPTLHVKEYMFEGVTMPTLNRGPGHWPGSAMPGHTGNMVVAGHRVSHTHPFRDLDKLRPGDPVVFTVGAGRYVYLVDHTKIVSPYDLYILDQTPDKTATLFACHPKGSTRQRIVVFLKYSPSQSQPAV